jgi:hypothetical protein
MIKLVVYLALAAGFIYVGSTVPLGKRTFFGHIRAIWATEEVQDMKKGIEDKAGPTVDRIKHGVEVGYHAATSDSPATGSGGSGGSGAPLDAAPAP